MYNHTRGMERVREVFSLDLLKTNEKIEKLEAKREELEMYLRAIDNGTEIVRKFEQMNLPFDAPAKAPTVVCEHEWTAKTETVKNDAGEDEQKPYWHCEVCLKVLFYDPAHTCEYPEEGDENNSSEPPRCTICHEVAGDDQTDDESDDVEQLELPDHAEAESEVAGHDEQAPTADRVSDEIPINGRSAVTNLQPGLADMTDALAATA